MRKTRHPASLHAIVEDTNALITKISSPYWHQGPALVPDLTPTSAPTTRASADPAWWEAEPPPHQSEEEAALPLVAARPTSVVRLLLVVLLLLLCGCCGSCCGVELAVCVDVVTAVGAARRCRGTAEDVPCRSKERASAP